MNQKSIAIVLVVAVLVVGGLFAAIQSGMFNGRDEADEAFDLESVFENELDLGDMVIAPTQFPGDSFSVDLVNFTEGGFIAVYGDDEGNPGELIGNSEYMGEGSYSDFNILLTREIVVGEVLYAVMHADTDGDGIFNPETDAILTYEDGTPIMVAVMVGTLAVEEEVENNTVVLDSGNYFFSPSEVTARAGEITIVINSNIGTHTFVIDELEINETIVTGTTFTFTAEPGTYRFYCDVADHEARGMVGTLTVTQ
jgi:plastocyanin